MNRVLCLISNMNAGGAETFLMKVYRHLDKTNYQMDFCLNVREICFYNDEILKNGGKIFFVPAKSIHYKQFKENLHNLIKSENYKTVLRITSSSAGFWDLKIAKMAGAKVCIARSSNSNGGKSLKAKFAHMIGKLLYSKYVDVKIAPSDLAAKFTFGLKRYNNGEIKILHNGVDLQYFHFDKCARFSVRKEFNISDEVFVIGHIGRLMNQKNHHFLLQIFNKIQKANPNVVLMLVGKGELENQLKNQAKDLGIESKVIFTGVRSDIPQILSAMDVFVFPSLFEGMPNTVIEAQAIGLPCVISDTITREADITGLVQYLSLNDPIDLWAETILKKVNSPRKDTHDDFIKNHYDIESTVQDFVKLVFQSDVNRGDA